MYSTNSPKIIHEVAKSGNIALVKLRKDLLPSDPSDKDIMGIKSVVKLAPSDRKIRMVENSDGELVEIEDSFVPSTENEFSTLRKYRFGLSPDVKLRRLQNKLENSPMLENYLQVLADEREMEIEEEEREKEKNFNDMMEKSKRRVHDAVIEVSKGKNQERPLSSLSHQSRPMTPQEIDDSPGAFSPIKRPIWRRHRKIKNDSLLNHVPTEVLPPITIKRSKDLALYMVTKPGLNSAFSPTVRRQADSLPLYEPSVQRVTEKELKDRIENRLARKAGEFNSTSSVDILTLESESAPPTPGKLKSPMRKRLSSDASVRSNASSWQAGSGTGAGGSLNLFAATKKPIPRNAPWSMTVGMTTEQFLDKYSAQPEGPLENQFVFRRPKTDLFDNLQEPSKPSELLKNALRPCSALLPQMIKPRESQFHRYFDLDVLYTHDSAMTELKNLGECKDGTNIVRLNMFSTKNFGEKSMNCNCCMCKATIFCQDCQQPFCRECWNRIAHHEHVAADDIYVLKGPTPAPPTYLMNDKPPIMMNSSGSVVKKLPSTEEPADSLTLSSPSHSTYLHHLSKPQEFHLTANTLSSFSSTAATPPSVHKAASRAASPTGERFELVSPQAHHCYPPKFTPVKTASRHKAKMNVLSPAIPDYLTTSAKSAAGADGELNLCASSRSFPPPRKQANYEEFVAKADLDQEHGRYKRHIVENKATKVVTTTIYKEISPKRFDVPNEIIIGKNEVTSGLLPSVEVAHYRGVGVHVATRSSQVPPTRTPITNDETPAASRAQSRRKTGVKHVNTISSPPMSQGTLASTLSPIRHHSTNPPLTPPVIKPPEDKARIKSSQLSGAVSLSRASSRSPSRAPSLKALAANDLPPSPARALSVKIIAEDCSFARSRQGSLTGASS